MYNKILGKKIYSIQYGVGTITNEDDGLIWIDFDGENKSIRNELAAQTVKNAQIEGTFAVLGEKLNAQRNEFMCALNRERDERCCGDNSIVTYANATFYPKMVADVTVGTTTTAQAVYNPIPSCGCCHK